MTPSELAAVNRAALENLQAVIDATIPRGKPGSLPMSLNPNTAQRVGHWHLLDTYSTGRWADLSGGDAEDDDKADLIGLVRHMAGGDVPRDEAAIALRAFLATVEPARPSPMRPVIPDNEVARHEMKVRPVRSLRRG